MAVLPPSQNDLTGIRLYFDGAEITTATGSAPINTALDELCFAAVPGYHTADRTLDFNGTIDEVRISSRDRSANWVWAEHSTVVSNRVFSSYGVVSAFPLVALSLAISLNGSNIVISWSTNAVAAMVIEESSDLITWTNSTAAMTTSGTNKTVTIVPQAAKKFYRLGI